MDIHKILQELHGERVRLDQAIAALEKLAGTAGAIIPTRTPAKHSAPAAKAPATEKAGARKPMSAATKKRLSELAKQRWAKKKTK